MKQIGISWVLIGGAAGLCLVAGAACAAETDTATLQRYAPHGPNRLDLSYTRFDANEGDVDLLQLGYTRAFGQHTRIGISGGVTRLTAPANPALGFGEKTEVFGFSDTLVTFQYDPSERLTASPWVPDSVGINASVLAPTGDPDDGIGSDFWLGSVGFGWAVDFVAHFWLIPSVEYEFTFAEGDLALPTHGAYGSCDIIWLFPFGGWIGYSLSVGREFETDDWVDDHGLTIGKMWSSGFGISFDVGTNDRIGPVPAREDRSWLANFYYQF